MKAIALAVLLGSAAAVGLTGQTPEAPTATYQATQAARPTTQAPLPASSTTVGTQQVAPKPATPAVNYPTPDTAILGPTQPVSFGRLVALQVKPLDQVPTDLYSITYIWRVTPDVGDMVCWPDNTRIWFGAGIDNVTYKIELIASYIFTKKTAGAGGAADSYSEPVNKLAMASFVVQVQGTNPPKPPNPPDPPNPPNPPNPPAPLPDGKYKLAQDAYNWAVDTSVVKLDQATMKANAKALGDSFDTTSKAVATAIAQIAAGTPGDIKNATDALAACRLANNAAVPTAKTTWLPWFQNLEARLKVLKLQNLDELRDAFAELAVGLRAAAQ